MKKVRNACIVDDDDIFRFILKKHLMSQGLAENILSFENGKEAMAYINGNRDKTDLLPDVIFLDINMPVMNGWDFITAYRQVMSTLSKQAPVIMVSSSVDDRDISKAEGSEIISEYITKPISKSTVVDLMEKTFVYS